MRYLLATMLLPVALSASLLQGCTTIYRPTWSDDSYLQATAPENRRGPNWSYANAPFQPQRALALGKVEDDGGAASGNYSFSLPIVSFPGRGQPLNLSLHFASQVWSSVGNGRMVFDADKDWPAPGWSIGYGKIVTSTNLFSGNSQLVGGLLIGANKSRQALVPAANEMGASRHMRIPGDSLTQVEICCYGKQGPYEANRATLTTGTGTTVSYHNFDSGHKDSSYYPIQITDANGNFTSIKYVVKAGKVRPPMIDSIKDTVGREVKFHYDKTGRLVTITAPGLDSPDHVYARFIYWKGRAIDIHATNNRGNCTPHQWTFDHLSGVIYPDTHHGFWLPSSTGYGTSSWFYQTTGVQLQDNGLDKEATVVTQGREANRTVFDYPNLTPTDCITKTPTYSTKTEGWRDDIAGADKEAVTTYAKVDLDDDTMMTVVHPDASSTRQYVSHSTNAAEGRLEGQLRRIENVDKSGAVLASTDFQWETVKGLDGGARQKAVIQNIDPMKRGKRTAFAYDPDFPSLVTWRKYFGYADGSTPEALEHYERTLFVRDPPYIAERLLALPQVAMHGVADSKERTERQFEYDKNPLTPVGQLEQHLQTHEPHLEPHCVRWETFPGKPPTQECIEWEQVPATIVTVRGNPTKITSFADAVNLRNPVSVNFDYDSTGNVLKTFDDFGAGTEVAYGSDYQFSLPTRHVIGSVDPSSTLRVTTTFQHYETGLLKEERDHDSRVTSYKYSKGDSGWRVDAVVSPDGVTATWKYDDDLLTTSVERKDAAGTVSEGSKVELDGRGNSRRLSDNRGSPFKVDTEYDLAGRVSRQSNPYSLEPAIWTTWTYDGQGRVKTQLSPGNTAETTFVYDTLPAPVVVPALPLAGSNVLSTDPWGRKRWQQSDSSGNLKYSVESIGSLSPEPVSLNTLTHYQHDAFGRLRTIVSGKQTRTFAYDDLGRLVGQSLPERQATLDATGTFGGQTGAQRFTDVYQYDARSNLVTSIDARGVRTKFDYAIDPLNPRPDPLNRLQGISYEVPPAHDTSSTIMPVPPVSFAYMTTGLPLRLESVDSGDLKVVLGYDNLWRPSTQETRFTSHLEQPFIFQQEYDSFGRPWKLTYPDRYVSGNPSGLRRVVQIDFARNAPYGVTLDETESLVSNMQYAPGGRLRSQTVSFESGPVTETFEVAEDTGLPSTHKVTDASGALRYGQAYEFRQGSNRAIAGQMTSMRNLAKPALSQDYYYDAAGRLGQSVTGDLAATPYDANALWQTYRYDRYGNRTNVDAFRISAFPCGSPGTPACNKSTASDAERDGVKTLPTDELTNRIARSDFGYDAAGNLTRATYQRNGAQQSRTFLYDAAGRLSKVADATGTIQEEFMYGHDRRRVRTIEWPSTPGRAPRVTYTNWFGGLPLSESINNLVVGPVQPIQWAKDTFHAGGRTHTETPRGRSIFINDTRGTGAELSAGGAKVLSHRASRPFGTESDASVGGDDNERFTTYKRSLVTGLDYAVNRFYSPELARFTQVDPLGSGAFRVGDSQSLNAYSYARNDPIGRIDPEGLKDKVIKCNKDEIWDPSTKMCLKVIAQMETTVTGHRYNWAALRGSFGAQGTDMSELGPMDIANLSWGPPLLPPGQVPPPANPLARGPTCGLGDNDSLGPQGLAPGFWQGDLNHPPGASKLLDFRTPAEKFFEALSHDAYPVSRAQVEKLNKLGKYSVGGRTVTVPITAPFPNVPTPVRNLPVPCRVMP